MADRELVDHLIRLGASEARVAGLDDSTLIGLAGDLALGAGLDLTLTDLARRCAISEERAAAAYRSLGLDPQTLAGFGEGDVELISLMAADESGVVDAVAEELLRVAGTALRRVAEATVAAYVQDVENDAGRRHLGSIELADLNMFSSSLVVAFAGTLGTAFRHHMWSAVRRQRSGQKEVAQPELIQAGVGFVDLVGYTPISQILRPEELMALLDDFERRAFDVATEHGGRIVKSIGDEVMITSHDLESVAMVALELVESFGGDPATRPRGGVSAGHVMFRMGDLYGPIVNVAARLVDVASPGEVLTDLSPADTEAFTLRPVGSRTLKGFEEPTDVWSVGSAEGSGSGAG